MELTLETIKKLSKEDFGLIKEVLPKIEKTLQCFLDSKKFGDEDGVIWKWRVKSPDKIKISISTGEKCHTKVLLDLEK